MGSPGYPQARPGYPGYPVGLAGYSMPRTGAAPPPRRSGRIGLVAALVVLLVIAGVAALVAVAVDRSDDQRQDAASGSASTETIAPTTTAPRQTKPGLLGEYCRRPVPWSEVPVYQAGQPARASVIVESTPLEGQPQEDTQTSGAREGSTVLSPHTDGKLIDDPSALIRTRAVVCIQRDRIVQTGRTCPMQWTTGPNAGTRVDPALAQSHYKVTVYELHSGGVLHKGELFTDADCPSYVSFFAVGTPSVGQPLHQEQVMEWVTTHFVDGKPA